MTLAASVGRDFLGLSRRFLDVLGPDGLGSESDQRHFAVDGLEPSWVLMPGTVGEAEEALGVCAAHDLAVVPAGLGVRLGYGRPPERLDVVLSTSRLERIVEHAAADLTLTAEAGATLAAVNDRLRSAGQWLPFDPPRGSETTIGGLIAAQPTGRSRQAFGTVRDRLLGVRALLADGTLIKSGGRVVKNVAGYDLQKLLVGSFGTLAVIVEATFKLQPTSPATRVLRFSSPNVELLGRLAIALADSVLGPKFLELFVDLERVATLWVGFAGLEEEMEDVARRAVTLAAEGGIEPASGPAEEATLSAQLDDVERAAEHSLVVRIGVRRNALASHLSSALESCRSVAGRVVAHAHAGLGVARLRLQEMPLERVPDLVDKLRGGARSSGGYLVVERAPVSSKRALDVWGPPAAGFDLMKGVKAAFDPYRLLSPGRFVGGL